MMIKHNDWMAVDLAHNWHPFMQMKDFETYPPKRIVKAEGIKLYSETTWYYDSISSWWCNILGHRYPAIVQAISKQMNELDHIMFGNFTHDPAIQLSKQLVDITPKGLNHVYYSDNGSTSVEVAMKMSLQYWTNLNQPKKTIMVCFEGSYHGDTIGAMSVSGVHQFNHAFQPLMVPVTRLSNPSKNEEKALQELVSLLSKQSQHIAFVIVEPLLMGAGGMHLNSIHFINEVRRLTAAFNVHLISDEVATGFGRLGAMFASDLAGIAPDFMCLSKALTNGQLPLAATMISGDIYQAFYADFEEEKTFYHGHTFTANPIACSVANATLETLKSMDWVSNVKCIEETVAFELKKLCDTFSWASNPRCLGCVGAIDLHLTSHRALFKFSQIAFDYHLTIRPLGTSIYLYLPLITTPVEVADILRRLTMCMDQVEKSDLF